MELVDPACVEQQTRFLWMLRLQRRTLGVTANRFLVGCRLRKGHSAAPPRRGDGRDVTSGWTARERWQSSPGVARRDSAGGYILIFDKKTLGPGGGIGRHARLRGVWIKPCWFESSPGHQSLFVSFLPPTCTTYKTLLFFTTLDNGPG